ncbi:MAG: hypothetical protein M4D85_00375 [Actinomycetota bacterium]|nr:hypothetical protein [Actinomycetota bacterium]
MKAITHRRLADSIAVLSVLMLAAGNALTYIARPADLLGGLGSGLVFGVGFGGVGWLLWRRVPRNPIGWCFSLAAFGAATTALAHGWVLLALTRPTLPGTLTRISALVDSYSFVLAVPLALVLPLLLLPDGRLPSRQWRPVVYAVVTGCALGALGFFTTPGPIDQEAYRELDNPLGMTGLGQIRGILTVVFPLTLLGGTLAGVVAVVRRFRRSRGVERQQLRWVALGGCCAGIGVAIGAAAGTVLPEGATAVVLFGLLAVPVCVGVAVLRYRLYDLGRVVSRTLSYAVVTALLVGVYLLLVTSLARLLPDSSSLAVAASTLAVAALFQPLRRRVQTAVDHRFNRARYDADRTIESFTRRLRDEVDLDDVRSDLLHVVGGALQPATVHLWLRDVTR